MTTRGSLPAELTSFVGRRQQLADIRRLVSSSRLVTLTGVGGVGKTRLALRTAADLRRAFPDGVWFVELAALDDPHLLPYAMASALGLDHVSESPLADLSDHLHDKSLLVVLDNCEQLTEACAVVVSKLLADAPDLRVLATSRHVLEVEGEHAFAVPPLSTPSVSDVPGGDASPYESVALLEDRARAVDPDFEVTDANRTAVSELCRRLDGLPLALELAAVWLRSLTPEQVVDRLDHRFQLLASGRRGGPARHQALEAAVAWSFDLCSPEEQMMWARASVFSGGFDLEAAEEVCSGDGISQDDALELLAGLVGKSIVVRHYDREHGTSWYGMLETIREYGSRQLTTAQADVVRRRHLEHYRSLANRFAAEYFTSHQAEWYLRLRLEHANIRAALEFCLGEAGEAVAALEIAAPLWPWWHAGHLREGVQYLTRALDLAVEPSRSRAYGLFALSNLTVRLSEFDRTLALLAESGELAARFGDDLLAARVKQGQGHAQLQSGHPAEAVTLLTAARDDARRLDQPRDEWRDVNLLSVALMLLGDPHAEEVSRQAMELAAEHGAEASRAWTLWGLGLVQWGAGEYERAIGSLREGIRLFLPMQNVDGISLCVQPLAWCAESSLPDERAARLLGAAEAIWRTVGGNNSQPVWREFDRRSEQRLRSAVGDRRFEAAFAEGAAYSLDQAVTLALGQAPHAGAPSPTTVSDAPAAIREVGLTRREWEVAQLLAVGLSNKDIAARLVVSLRTAETHVEHILSKLGFNSRTQVGKWVMDQRAPESNT